MNDKILITGGLGMMGRKISSLLMQNTKADIYLLIHKQGSSSDKEKILLALSLPSKKEFRERLKIIKGDITKPRLGMEKADYQDVTDNITHIIHAAASTRFDLPIEEARKINVIGTKNVALLAKKCSRIRQFGFLSTAYISGKRIGSIKEAELEHTAEFVNTYEQSKYEAEILLKDFSNDFPISVYRLSTVFGDSKTGKVSHFIAPHQAVRMMYLGLASMLPGTPDYSVDLISSDYTASTIFDLYWKNFKQNQTFHITHGNQSFTLKEIIDESYKQLAIADPKWSLRNYPKPAIVSGEAFDLFMNSATAANNPILQKTLNALNHFAHQLLYPKKFNRSNLIAVLPDYEKRLPPIQEYYGKVIQYCIKTKWGKIQ
jgi:thioester reductase-like protein